MDELFTQEELELMDERTREKVTKILQDYNSTVEQLNSTTDGIRKIYSNPQAKRKFAEALRDAGLESEIPQDPIDNYVAPLESKVSELETELAKTRERQRVEKALVDYGIPSSEFEKVIKFQQDYAIADNVKAIELYAQQRKESEAEQSATEMDYYDNLKNPDELLDYDKARQKAIEDLNQILK